MTRAMVYLGGGLLVLHTVLLAIIVALSTSIDHCAARVAVRSKTAEHKQDRQDYKILLYSIRGDYGLKSSRRVIAFGGSLQTSRCVTCIWHRLFHVIAICR